MSRSFVVEADGGSRGNPGPAAYGALVRDAATGRVIVERAEAIGVASNNVAEYRGLIAGLRAAAELDPEAEVLVRMDSKLVVEQMSGRWKIKHEAMRALALEAREAYTYERVRYEWIPREINREADRLVNLALDAEVRGERLVVDRVLSDDGEAAVSTGPTSATAAAAAVASAASSSAAASSSSSASRPRPVVPGWATDLGAPTTLLGVRHGATDFSLQRRFSGAGGADMPMAAVGHHQAAAVAAEIVARGGADAVVCSPLLRTRETAAVIAAALAEASGTLSVEVEVVEGLRECAFGEWDGLTFAEVREAFPTLLEAWVGSTDVAPPGGESFAEVRDRVDVARRGLLEAFAGQRVVVVSHVTPLKVLAGLALDAPLASLYRMELAPCSLTTMAWWADGNASLRGWAESGHLRGIVVPDGT